jgi:hypothetical protein
MTDTFCTVTFLGKYCTAKREKEHKGYSEEFRISDFGIKSEITVASGIFTSFKVFNS